MKYISTRGGKNKKSFKEVLLRGLAEDGGLFVPESLPTFSHSEIQAFGQLPYNECAYHIIKPFIGDDIPANELKALINDSYSTFTHAETAPLRQLNDNHWLLELFHGPTLAFKDFALQLVGRLLDKELKQKNKKAIVLGATSGDTGSAAIAGCQHSDQMACVILHPHQRVSAIQRRQMTTVLSPHVHNIAIEGHFDDCQSLVKQCFSDQSFLPSNTQLVAINSINWARIMAQIVYYFYAAVRLGAPQRAVSFAVPTGNFGNIYAGYIAKQMGLPIQQLITATNKNDILHRFFQFNDYSRKPLQATLSPSMDIMVSSNFERLLYNAYQNSSDTVARLMTTFQNEGKLAIDSSVWEELKQTFTSYTCDDKQTCHTIRSVYQKTNQLLDPHTATAVYAAQQVQTASTTPVISLATAHPAKFEQAIKQAQLTLPPYPQAIAALEQKEERYSIKPNHLPTLRQFIKTL